MESSDADMEPNPSTGKVESIKTRVRSPISTGNGWELAEYRADKFGGRTPEKEI